MSDKELLWRGKPLEYRKPSPLPSDPIFEELDDQITALTAERDALARTLATLAAAGITTGEDGAPRFHGLSGTEIEAMKEQGDFLHKMLLRFVDMTRVELRGTQNESHPAWTMPLAKADMALHGWDALTAASGRGADGEATE